MSDENSLEVAREMINAWESLDWDRVANTFSEEGLLQTVPAPPFIGRAAIRDHLLEVASGIEKLSFRVKHLVASNGVVTFERFDEFTYRGKESSVPVVGIMEVEDGKVSQWREYFDLATMVRAMTP